MSKLILIDKHVDSTPCSVSEMEAMVEKGKTKKVLTMKELEKICTINGTMEDIRKANEEMKAFLAAKQNNIYHNSGLVMEALEDNLISDTPHRGASYIIPDGKFIWKKGYDHPALLNELEFSNLDEEAVIDEYGWIRVDSGLSYTEIGYVASFIELPVKEITEEQYASLLNWMENCCSGDVFQISATNGDFQEYDMDFETPEDLIEYIKYYYNTGSLRY